MREHVELTPTEYTLAQDTVDRGRKIQDTDRSLTYVLEEPAGYVLVVKATQTGNALFVTSYRRLSTRDAKRDREIARLLELEKKK